MTWIQPLELEKLIINIFSGSPDIFGAVALFFITMVAAYFKMTAVAMFFLLGLFLLMFSGYIGTNFLILFAIIGGLLIGSVIAKLFE